MAVLDRLAPLRAHKGLRRTQGLDDATITRFAASHAELIEAIEAADQSMYAKRSEMRGTRALNQLPTAECLQ